MATLGPGPESKQHFLKARIKNLVNNDLKELCRQYGYNISGNKSTLQERVLRALDTVAAKNDMSDLELFEYRVFNHGSSPPVTVNLSAGRDTHHYRHSGPLVQSQGHSRATASAVIQDTWKVFKTSPFYQPIRTVYGLELLSEVPQNRKSVDRTLHLHSDDVHLLRTDPAARLMLYCGAFDWKHLPRVSGDIDVAFPNQVEVKFNREDVKSNYKGLKSKPGSTKPADLVSNSKNRKSMTATCDLSIVYALTNKPFTFTVILVRYVGAEMLTKRITEARSIPKQQVVAEMIKAEEDPDIAATSVRMSLKDPISTLRISLPVRSTVCTHNQCFDGAMFMQLQEQAPQWLCPVCNKPVTFEMLCVDRYFEEILQQTPQSIEQVDIEPNGEWRVIKEPGQDDESTATPTPKPRNTRASYDDDFDDDLVEVPPPSAQPASTTPIVSQRMALPLAPLAKMRSTAMQSPPLSRETSVAQSTAPAPQSNKRPADTFIDLTLSDDEDPRPAKRPNTSTRDPPRHAYSTPHSLPDPRYLHSHGHSTQSPDPNRFLPDGAGGLASGQLAPGSRDSTERPASRIDHRTGQPTSASSSPINTANRPAIFSPSVLQPQIQQRSSGQPPTWNQSSRPGSAHVSQQYHMNVQQQPPSIVPTQGSNVRPPSQAGSIPNGLRLPPIQTAQTPGAVPPQHNPPQNYGGQRIDLWQRSGYPGYSQSPDRAPGGTG